MRALALSDAEARFLRLLPAFDTYLLGYRSRDLAVAPQDAKRVNAGGGMIRPVLLVDGQVVGTWASRRQRGGLTVSIEPFQSLAPEALPGLKAEVEDLGRFLHIPAQMQVLPLPAQ